MKILRWALTPFAAIGGSLALHIALTALNDYAFKWYNKWLYGADSYVDFVVPIVIAYYVGAAFVWCGAMTAPARKVTTANALKWVLVGIVAVSFVLNLCMGAFSWQVTFSTVATGLGGLLKAEDIDGRYYDEPQLGAV